jgi:hypothetical protein
MKKYFFLLIFFFIFSFSLHGEESFNQFFVLSSGYSLLHNYDSVNHSGFDFSLNYEPVLIETVNVDISLTLNVYKRSEQGEFILHSDYNMIHAPSLSMGPRFQLPVFEKIKPYAGAGIHFTVAVSHDTVKNESTASFGPGAYIKTGVDIYLNEKILTGFETYYKWCFTKVPHTVSFRLRIGFIY